MMVKTNLSIYACEYCCARITVEPSNTVPVCPSCIRGNKIVVIAVHGGTVNLVHKPSDIRLIVRDYDVEGAACTCKDENGESFRKQEYKQEL